MVAFRRKIAPRPIASRVGFAGNGVFAVGPDDQVPFGGQLGRRRKGPAEGFFRVIAQVPPGQRNGRAGSVLQFDPVGVITEIDDVGMGLGVGGEEFADPDLCLSRDGEQTQRDGQREFHLME